jgi:hypothetical protein
MSHLGHLMLEQQLELLIKKGSELMKMTAESHCTLFCPEW